MVEDYQNNRRLLAIMREDGLMQKDVVDILGISARSTVQDYMQMRRHMPDRALRLLELETGRVKPAWANRRKR